MEGLLARGRAKSSVASSADKGEAEVPAEGCEQAAKWIFFLSLTLGAIVFAPDYFYDGFEIPKLFFVQVGAAVICCLLLCTAALRGRLHLRLPLIFLPLMFTAAVAVLSITWSVNHGLALERLYHIGTLVLFCFFALRFYRARPVEPLLYFIIFAAAGLSAWALALDLIEPLEKWVFPHYIEVQRGGFVDHYRELISTQGNPNFLMHILVMSVPAALGALVHRLASGEKDSSRRQVRWLTKALLVLAFILPLFCFFKSQNRSSMVGVAVALLIFVALSVIFSRDRLSHLFQLGRPLLSRILAGLAVVILTTTLAIFFTETGRSFVEWVGDSTAARLAHWRVRFGNLTDMDNIDVYSRVIFLETSTGMIADDPVLGKGIGQFLIYFPGYKTHEQWQRLQLTQHGLKRWAEIASYAHNEYLQVFVDLGVFAFVSFLLFWVLLARLIISSLRRSAGDPRFFLLLGAASGIAGTLLNALFTFPLQTVTSGMFFWALVGLLIAQCEQFAPEGRLPELTRQLSFGRTGDRRVLIIVAGALLVVCFWGSFRLIRSQHLFFDALKNHARKLDYSIRQCARAVELAPHHFEFHYVQGWFHRYARNYDAARISFEKSAEQAPYFPETYKHLSVLYYVKGDYRKAEQSLNRYFKIYPPGVTQNLHYLRGLIYLKDTVTDRIVEADSILSRLGTVNALINLARGYRERGRPGAAMDLMPQVMRMLTPTKGLEQFLSAVAFFGHTSLAVGDTVTARKQFEEIIRTLNRYDPEGYAELRKQTELIIEELDERDK